MTDNTNSRPINTHAECDHQIYKQLLHSYSRARISLGLLGVFLIAVLTLHGIFYLGEHFKTSISHTYHSELGDLVVGVLWAIGIFLIVYRDYDQDDDRMVVSLLDVRRNWDRWVAIFAGIGALIVANHPVDPVVVVTCKDPLTGVLESLCHPTGGDGHGDVFGKNTLHFGGALVFFVCICIFCFKIFPSKQMPGEMTRAEGLGCRPPSQRPNTIYFSCGSVIAFCLVGMFVYSLTEKNAPGFHAWLESFRAFFILEAVAVLAFSIAWIRRSREYI